MIEPKIAVLKDLLIHYELHQYKRILRKQLGVAFRLLGYHQLHHGKKYKAAVSYFRSLSYPDGRANAVLHLAAFP